MRFSSIKEAEQALQPFMAVSHAISGKALSATRTKQLLAHVGNPDKQLHIIHVAGTSGKTSTTYYISALLAAAGARVGHTVSPHMDSITERVQIQGQALSDQQFCAHMERFLDLIADMPETPSWFEVITVFALWVFAQEDLEYAVLETGVGGRDDSTNAVEPHGKVCVITDIGYDHMRILGNTLPAIAEKKAGIIQRHNQVFMHIQANEILDVVRSSVRSADATLTIIDAPTVMKSLARRGVSISGLPDFQQRNWLLAYSVYDYITDSTHRTKATQSAVAATQQIIIPGRMDHTITGDKTVVMDGAHNTQKMTAFVRSLALRYPNQPVCTLVAIKRDKETRAICELLATVSTRIIVTGFTPTPGTNATAASPDELAAYFRDAGRQDVHIEPDPIRAYQLLLQCPQKIAIVTGSFYLLSQLRAANKPT